MPTAKLNALVLALLASPISFPLLGGVHYCLTRSLGTSPCFETASISLRLLLCREFSTFETLASHGCSRLCSPYRKLAYHLSSRQYMIHNTWNIAGPLAT